MEANHSTAPWTADGYVVYSDPAYETVCEVASSRKTGANARLIAAAPDLLAACIALIKTDDLQDAIDKARAAIAKAGA